MVKKSYNTPVLEVVEIGLTLLHVDSSDKPLLVPSPDVPMSNRDDWDPYDI